MAFHLITFWPVWRWYAARMNDGSDEPWGWAALVVALLLIFRERPARKTTWGLPVILTLGYTASYHMLSPLPRAIVAVAALGATVSAQRFGRRMHYGILGLLFLSLPVAASLQFYLGYPLRAMGASVVAPLLRMQGLAVAREGIALEWNGQPVVFDAPCSGVKMLWAGLFLAFTLACFSRLSGRRTIALVAFSLVAIVAGNILRSAALFYVEAGIVKHLPSFAHSGIGVVAFAMMAILIAFGAGRLAAERKLPSLISSREGRKASSLRFASGGLPHLRGAGGVAVAAICALAALTPLLPLKSKAQPAIAGFPGWPTTFEGCELKPLPLSEREERFAADFPGRLARFTDGKREITLRWVARETRSLHPTSDCFKALGYSIKALPLRADEAGRLWSRFEAKRGDESLRVSERIHSDGGDQSWTDVSSWYWQTLLGKTGGPWWAVTVAERSSF